MDQPRSSHPFQRIALSACVAVVVFGASVAPALAQVAATVSVNSDIPRSISEVRQSISTQILQQAVSSVMNALQSAAGQMAYDAATWVASGGKGQGTVFYKKSFGDYLTDVGSHAAGAFIDSLSSNQFFQGLGIDLCRPRTPSLMLNIQLGLAQSLPHLPNMPSAGPPPQAACDLRDVISNYQNLYQTLSNTDALGTARHALDPTISDLGTMASIFDRMESHVARQTIAETLSRAEGAGFRPTTNPVTGDIRTPSQVVEQATNLYIVDHPKQSVSDQNLGMLGSAASVGAVQLLTYSLKIFGSTLISQSLKNIFDRGIDNAPVAAQTGSVNPDDLFSPGATDARNAAISLRAVAGTQTSNIELITEMENCPRESRGTWNCVMDSGLVQAIQDRQDQSPLTIGQAMKLSLLHPDYRLIPATDARRNRDQNCFRDAYCAGNLQKLRVMRILPVGFEFAANSDENKNRGAQNYATLKEVVDGFSACGEHGQRDASHPWCHVIDPNWVITSFPQRCLLTGHTDTLESSTVSVRKEECQDVQTCLKRDNLGNCVGGYGYCLAEKTVYRFTGNICSEAFASCRTYQNRQGQNVSYLRSTLDAAQCSEANAGCLWYATARNASGAWSAQLDGTGQRLYANRALQTCNAAAEGCTKLYEVNFGQPALNLAANPSFEQVTSTILSPHGDPVTLPVAWYPPNLTSMPQVVTHGAYDGANALQFSDTASHGLYQNVILAPARTYTFSAWFKAGASGAVPEISFDILQFKDPEQTQAADATDVAHAYMSNGCTRGPHGTLRLQARDTDGSFSDYRRLECTFMTTASTRSGRMLLAGTGGAFLDAVQLEEADFATRFVDGYNQALPKTYLKVPPDDLQCTGSIKDPEICHKFAAVCTQQNAGCDSYTDVDGGSAIPAIYTTADTCPASCVGYAQYQKSASAFDLVRDPDTRFNDHEEPVAYNFIASTAQTCTQANVGCAAFTDISSGPSGGQTKYFSYGRLCETPSERTQTYFTWEGSDTTGYQLKTWSLVKDTTLAAGTPNPPKLVLRRGPDQAFKDPANCNAATWTLGLDGDCRQFYDASGNVFYVYLSQTVVSSVACTPYRLATAHADDCTKTGGQFTSGACVYNLYPPESRVCPVAAVGCRAFLGSGAGNLESVLREDFSHVPTSFDGGRISQESVQVGASSLRLDPLDVTGNAHADVIFPTDPKEAYRVSFWAKVSAQPQAVMHLDLADPGATPGAPVGSVNLNNEWQRFSLGPFKGGSGVNAQLNWTAAFGEGQHGVAYLTQVNIERIRDVAYVIQDSWQTPAECDRSASGVPEPQAMLGCRAYKNHQNKIANARQFTHLCSEDAVGCTAYVDSRNTDHIGPQAFPEELAAGALTSADGETPTSILIQGERVTSSTWVRPGMRYLYLIDDPSKHCQADQASCRAFGKPNLSPDRLSLSEANPYDTVYLQDDVSQYGQSLCRPSDLYCEAYNYGAAKAYFRDPGPHACEYRQNVAVSGLPEVTAGSYSGWFQKGLDVPCYPAFLSNGQSFGLSRTGDAGYQGWGGTCPNDQAECTEFRDPNDHTDPLHHTGKPYFFLNNDNFDTRSCAGNADPGTGCILLRNMSNQALTYSSTASYAHYAQHNYQPIPPVDCIQNQTDPSCISALQHAHGTCQWIVRTRHTVVGPDRGLRVTNPDGSLLVVEDAPQTRTGGTCLSNNDCVDFVRTNYGQVGDVPEFSARDLGGGASRIGENVNPQCLGVDAQSDQAAGNDSNTIVKVNTDRDCAQWLGCASSESVFDRVTNQYRDVCTNVAICDAVSGDQAGSFCGHYVDRSSSSTEPILTKGSYFNLAQYAQRQVGLGTLDYSGYAIPESFQAPDLQNTHVAVDGLAVNQGRYPPPHPEYKYTFAQDYRLATLVDISREWNQDARAMKFNRPDVNQAAILCNGHEAPSVLGRTADDDSACHGVVSAVAVANPGLHLCQQVTTHQIGYYLPNEASSCSLASCAPLHCNLPVHGNLDKSNFPELSQGFAHPATDPLLQQAFPGAECRAYPEADSPFPASTVSEWDTGKNPPQAKSALSGFKDVNVCEFGEDCACSYKRVTYQGDASSKFYNMHSSNVPPGLCFGGPRNGESCIPGTIFKTPPPATAATPPGGSDPTSPGAPSAAAMAHSNLDSNAHESCGPPEGGGTCVATSKIELVRGIYGQCLERDTTRANGADPTSSPCLTWNPTPLLFGDKDAYHYVPSAGYLPPQNSGQYYCLSSAKPSRSKLLGESDFTPYGSGDAARFAGNLRFMSYNYRLVADGSPIYTGNAPGGAIDNVLPSGGTSGAECTDADDLEDSNEDQSALRLITTGRGFERSYTETFFTANAASLGSFIEGVPPGTRSPTILHPIEDLYDSHIGFFDITPIRNYANATGRLCCGYQKDWVDNLGDVNCDAADDLQNKDQAWRQSFFQNFTNTTLNRGSEAMLADNQGIPLSFDCVHLAGDGTGGDAWHQCYFKTWEVGYRADGQKKFIGINGSEGASTVLKKFTGLNSLNQSPYYQQCESDKAYFAIRAVFQTRVNSPDPQNFSVEQIAAHKKDVRGPWRFVGFWVTTCGGHASSEHFIYSYVTLQTADACRDLAEVKSRNSEQDAAFTDRVWPQGNFQVPGLSLQYNARFSPFSSALNTGPADQADVPLFQTGAAISGFSPLKPPIFLAPGKATYFRTSTGSDQTVPKDKWAYLTNLFARVYRVYRYYDQSVSKDDKVCYAGANQGRKCSPDAPASGRAPETGPSQDCRATKGVCQPSADATVGVKLCNSLSGINSGLRCDDDPNKCHLAPIVNGAPHLLTCQTQSGWTLSDGQWHNATVRGGSDGHTLGGGLSQADASTHGAFKCANGAVGGFTGETNVYAPRNCTAPTDLDSSGRPSHAFEAQRPSSECPLAIHPGRRITVAGAFSAYGDANSTASGWGECLPDPASLLIAGFLGSTPASSAVPGYCAIHLPNGGRIDLKPVNGYAPCYHDYDCAFTGQNFWLATPEIASFRASGGPGLMSGNRLQGSGEDELIRFPGAAPTGPGVTGPGDRPHASFQYNIAGCDDAGALVSSVGSVAAGTCDGGVYDGALCFDQAVPGSAGSFPSTWPSSGPYRCTTEAAVAPGSDVCGPVTSHSPAPDAPPDPTKYYPTTQCLKAGFDPGVEMSQASLDNPDDLSSINSCMHGVGYRPRTDLCPDPSDEFCGLIAYDRTHPESGGSLDPDSTYHLPTDVTLGNYTPNFLGFSPDASAVPSYKYIAYYTPVPPRLAAPDVRNCSIPGQCPIQRFGSFSFNGQYEGLVNAVGGQQKSVIRFYAWAAHNQMPLRQLTLDWGDGSKQQLPDARLKNHKPFCGVQKECYNPTLGGHTGLTCQSDSDCPPGLGQCRTLGSCVRRPAVICSTDDDCTQFGTQIVRDTCNIRTYFGNSPDACDANYFEFSHVYTCQGQNAMPACFPGNHCSADPTRACSFSSSCAAGDTCVSNTAPPGGCWDATAQSCRYTPRVLLQDNWGWCTGECRSTLNSAGALTDAPTSAVIHKYGGCYAGETIGNTNPDRRNIRSNQTNTELQSNDECAQDLPLPDVARHPPTNHLRPWIVYPGALELRIN